MMDDSAKARRDAIRLLLRTARIGTQEDLREQLERRGFDVTQATLSRDLANVGARRVTLPDGGSVYELEGSPATALGDELARVAASVIAVEESVALVVVMTTPGAASTVALAIDRARMEEALGTVAGDDTLFIAPKKTSSTQALAKKLRTTWRKT
jgi:transcriptional regulator of arginine metabolism